MISIFLPTSVIIPSMVVMMMVIIASATIVMGAILVTTTVIIVSIIVSVTLVLVIVAILPSSLVVVATMLVVAAASVVPSAMMSMMMSISVGMRSLSIGSQQGRRVGFVHHIASQSPQNDADASLVGLFRRWQGVDAVFPANVDVAAKSKDAIVGLGKVHATGGMLLLIVLKLWVVLQVLRRSADEG
jgi:hypothetical protein